jgi:transcription elongation factor Elf1
MTTTKCPKCGSEIVSKGAIGTDHHNQEMEADWEECEKCGFNPEEESELSALRAKLEKAKTFIDKVAHSHGNRFSKQAITLLTTLE